MKNRTNKHLRRVARSVGASSELDAVRCLVERYRLPKEPLELILTKLGVSEVIRGPLPFDGGVFDYPGGTRRRVVKLNSLSPETRQRFTLAHELGHLFLDDLLGVKPQCRKDEQLERACDAIAAELLMPMEETRTHVETLGSASPAHLIESACRFGVSLQAAATRIHYDLKLWPQSMGLWQFEDSGPGVPANDPREVWYVGKRRWMTKRPPFRVFYDALTSSGSLRARESYFENGEMKPIALEVLQLHQRRILGIVT
jgi:hypothetical protein